MTLVALRIYYRLTGSCLSYCPDANGVCRVCRVPGAGYTSGPLRNEKEANMNVYAACKKFGIARIEAGFSGGNDEGGYDEVSVIGEHGAPVPGFENFTPWNEGQRSIWDPALGRYVDQPAPNPDRALIARHLEGILDGKYGSFAGDFHVHGTVIVDVGAGTTTMQGTEEVAHGEEFSESY